MSHSNPHRPSVFSAASLSTHTITMRRVTRILAVLAALALPGTANAQDAHVFRVSLDGRQAGNTSSGTGTATVFFIPANREVIVTGFYSGLLGNRTNQHIHAAPAGRTGGIVVGLTATGTTSGSIGPNKVFLTPAQVPTMLAGGMYINIHSTRFSGGEIRGQIISCPLYYKFDRGIGNIAANYGSLWALRPLQLSKTPTTFNSWAPARAGFGSSLRGTKNTVSTEHNYVDTGWKGPITGDLTVAWWMKERVAPGTGLSYLFGGIGSWSCFTNGVAGTGLWMRGWGGPDLKYPGNIQVPARGAPGIHIALTLNASTKRAQWYINAVPVGAPIVIPNGVNVPVGTSSFKIGKHTSNTFSSAYDLDEFRVCNRVASATEIRAWSSRPSAASGYIDGPCLITHLTAGGTPTVGNARYTMTIFSPRNLRYLFVVGARRVAPFDLGLAFPSLRGFGCRWYANFDIQIIGTAPTGYVAIPAPIPNLASIVGVQVDTQVLGFTPPGGPIMSNALSHAIER